MISFGVTFDKYFTIPKTFTAFCSVKLFSILVADHHVINENMVWQEIHTFCAFSYFDFSLYDFQRGLNTYFYVICIIYIYSYYMSLTVIPKIKLSCENEYSSTDIRALGNVLCDFPVGSRDRLDISIFRLPLQCRVQR